jgi:WD40 repeat protein
MYVKQRARRIISLNNDSIAIAGFEREVTLWNLKTKAQLLELTGHTMECWALVKIKDDLLASGSKDTTAKVWNYTSGRLLKNLTHSKQVYGLISLNGENIASCSQDNQIRIWNTTSGQLLQMLVGHEASVLSMAFISRNNMLVSASWDKTIRMWNLSTGNCTRTLSDEYRVGIAECLLVLIEDGNSTRQLASGDKDFSIKIWHIDKEALIASIEGHTGVIRSLVNLRKGYLASASADMSIKVWSLKSLEYGAALLATLRGHSDEAYGLLLLCDGYVNLTY